MFLLVTTDWKDLYGYIEEDVPPGMMDPLGKISHTTWFDDSNYACLSSFSHRCLDFCDECAKYMVLKEAEVY